MTATGQLVRVDTTAKTFTIKPATSASSSPSSPSAPGAPPSADSSRSSSSTPTEFTYNDSTKVTGAQKTVEGLATMSGTEVEVHYTKQGEKNLATEIEIKEKKS